MSMTDWARREIEMACKRQNPDWDGKSFDYGCACYQSALKAYESIMEDGHSGTSFGFTRNILKRLLDELPLSPITDEDFFYGKDMASNSIFSESELDKRGLKSIVQCPRCCGLFRSEYKDGKIEYSDNNRCYCKDIHKTSLTYHNSMGTDLVDKLFPIKMPYFPISQKYVIYTEDFLTDEKNGDYDTKAFLYIITPDKEKIEVNKFYAEINGKFVEISKEEYEKRKLMKLYPFYDE